MTCRKCLVALTLFMLLGGSALATDYKSVTLVHWKTDGFTTVMHQSGSNWDFFVINGAATMVFTRDTTLSAPDVSYSDDGSYTKLTLAATIERKYVCTAYQDTREGYPDNHCNASCSPCVCSECVYTETEDSSSLPDLVFGP